MPDKRTQVKAQFEAEGVSIAEWARARGFSSKLVYRVLDGGIKGTRGESYRIAVELGLKEAPKQERFRPIVEAA